MLLAVGYFRREREQSAMQLSKGIWIDWIPLYKEEQKMKK